MVELKISLEATVTFFLLWALLCLVYGLFTTWGRRIAERWPRKGGQ